MWSYGLAARALIKSDELVVVLDSPISVTDSPIDTTQRDNIGPKTHKHATDSREGRDSNDSQKAALGPGKANAMTASSVSSRLAP